MKKTMDGQFEVVKIDQIKELKYFKEFYEVQSEEQLKSSLKSEGQLIPIVVTTDYTLLDGYRRLNLLGDLGCEYVKIQMVDVETTIGLRVSLNTYRVKTDLDLTNEVFHVLNSVPKRQ